VDGTPPDRAIQIEVVLEQAGTTFAPANLAASIAPENNLISSACTMTKGPFDAKKGKVSPSPPLAPPLIISDSTEHATVFNWLANPSTGVEGHYRILQIAANRV
jgi:hypothetical protein